MGVRFKLFIDIYDTYTSLMVQICFISNHQHGKLISILYSKYLPMKL